MPIQLNIDDMPAGREMDALIAETAMGWQWGVWDIKTNELYGSHVGFIPASIRTVRELEPSLADWQRPATGTEELNSDDYMHVPYYSTDISEAFKIFDKLIELGYCPNLVYDDNGHFALSTESVSHIGSKVPFINVVIDESLWCDTVPLAICRATYKIAINKVS